VTFAAKYGPWALVAGAFSTRSPLASPPAPVPKRAPWQSISLSKRGPQAVQLFTAASAAAMGE
jgi:hypothetical protein